ncbi:MAG: hypothetical protein GX442_22825 [Candidatus Riflebacteria bacterium]|nr:hypothetical protein [Candidatus Riflebacteria bacterium]
MPTPQRPRPAPTGTTSAISPGRHGWPRQTPASPDAGGPAAPIGPRPPLLLLLAVLTVLVAGAHHPLPAADAPVIGTVDLAALLVFHPGMAAYDPFNRAFLATGPATATGPAAADPARSAPASQDRRRDLEGKIAALEARMDELRARFDADRRAAQAAFDANLPGLATGPALLETHRHTARLNGLSLRFHGQMRALQVQIGQLRDAIGEELSTGLPSRFTTPAETWRRFQAILEEVRQVTRQVAAARGLTVVLDAGPARLARGGSDHDAPDLPSNLEYGEMFSPAAPSADAPDPLAAQGLLDLQRSRADNWFRNRGPILQPFAALCDNTFVVAGGCDLTCEVMTALLTRHGVGSDVQAVILQAVRGGR